MKTGNRILAVLLSTGLACQSIPALADDIDIFIGSSGGAASSPNVLIVLDNTPNWSRQNQKWPGGITQGQAEARAIKNALAAVGNNVNVGLMEFVTEGNANNDGGYLRFAVKPMTDANKSLLGTKLDTIYGDINGVHEKTNGSRSYGNLMYDVYNYFSSATATSPSSSVYASSADATGYDSTAAALTKFKSPLAEANACASTSIIFIGNPSASGPSSDSAANTTNLTNLLTPTALTQYLLPKYKNDVVDSTESLAGVTAVPAGNACYASAAAVKTVYGWGYSKSDNLCRLYAATTSKISDSIAGAGLTNGSGNAILSDALGNDCPVYDESINQSGATAFDLEGACGNPYLHGSNTSGVTGTYNNGCVVGAATSTSFSASGWTPYRTDSLTVGTSTTSTVAGTATVSTLPNPLSTSNLVCPGNTLAGCTYEVSSSEEATSSTAVVSAVTSMCFLPSTSTKAADCSADPTKCKLFNYDAAANVVTYTNPDAVADIYSAATMGLNTNFNTVQCTATGSNVTCPLDCPATSSCQYQWTPYSGNRGPNCPKYGTGQSAVTAQAYTLTVTPSRLKRYSITMRWQTGDSGNTCTTGSVYKINGRNLVYDNKIDTTQPPYADTGPRNADEWTSYLFKQGVTVGAGKQNINTYTIDVYNAQPNAEHTSLLLNMAKYGGGRYFSANNEDKIKNALVQILTEVQSVNSTFASASLPVSATNRTQNANQVFIGMFRPDKKFTPRWFGNLKQYAVGRVSGGDLDLVDRLGNPATNLKTGFISDCASSFWNVNSYVSSPSTKGYWDDVLDKSDGALIDPSPASACVSGTVAGVTVGSPYSDLPDGPSVEKGAVAAVIRRGNNPAATTTTPTWSVSRNVLTRSAGALVPFNAANTGFASTELINFVLGKDINGEQSGTSFRAATDADTVRPSVHGDVVHSRPLPVNYGDSFGVIAYYGANDGALRAVDSKNGNELWAFIPPEFNESRLARLKSNTPLLSLSTNLVAGTEAKDYMFDGSIGVSQNADNSNVVIYPSQRRGGRMVYALDVKKPYELAGTTLNYPKLLWHQGCETPSTTTDTGCTTYDKTIDTSSSATDFSAIGQTWSTPAVAYIKGYGSNPVVVFGGGYDACEDADARIASPTCVTPKPKGSIVYILDATSGKPVRSFSTDRSVVADVAMVDVDGDNQVDYAYIVDTGGNLYRINFINGPTNKTALASTNWSMQKIAYTNGAAAMADANDKGGRKMLFNVALLPYQGTNVYVAVTTGDREHPLISNYPFNSDSSKSVKNRAYVYLDRLTNFNATIVSAYPDGTTAANKPNYLIQCDLDSNACTADYTNSTICETPKILPTSTERGWRMTFPDNGEQGVTSALIAGGMVTFSTNRPLPAADGTCASTLGEAKGYWVNLLNASGAIDPDGHTCGGDRSTKFAGGGLPPSPVTGIVPVDGKPTVVVIGAPPRTGGAASPVKPEQVSPIVSAVRSRKYQYTTIDK